MNTRDETPTRTSGRLRRSIEQRRSEPARTEPAHVRCCIVADRKAGRARNGVHFAAAIEWFMHGMGLENRR